MSGFIELFENSRRVEDADLSQKHVRENFPLVCQQNDLQFWKCVDPLPVLKGKSLFLGIADYDARDLELLDALIARPHDVWDSIHVFLLADCANTDSLRILIPDFDHYPAQNPLLAVWDEAECVFTSGGYAAVQWLNQQTG